MQNEYIDDAPLHAALPYINQEVRYEKRDKETASDDYGSGSKG